MSELSSISHSGCAAIMGGSRRTKLGVEADEREPPLRGCEGEVDCAEKDDELDGTRRSAEAR